MSNRDGDVIDSVRGAGLERLVADRIAPPLGALCERSAEGDRADRQGMSRRYALFRPVADAIRSAVRPVEDTLEALEGDRRASCPCRS